ncbi:MAG: hypothetical protein PVH41_01855 [Anaerolineae bacterium]|jgi:hypothetical protein
MKRARLPALLWILFLLAQAAHAAPTRAMPTAQHDIDWHVVSSGGRRMAGAQFDARGSAGQVTVGRSSGSSYDVCAGYWCMAGVRHAVFLPLVLRSVP